MSSNEKQAALAKAIKSGPFMSTRYGWAGPAAKWADRAFWIDVHVGSDGQRCFYGASREEVASKALAYYREWSKQN